jgi:plasmid stabilization system protein ParE
LSDRLADDLFKVIFSLEFMPEMYQKYLWEYRRVIVKWSYKIIYKIEEEKKKVIIIRVIRTERKNFKI